MKYRALIKRNADGAEQWSSWHDSYGNDDENLGSILFNWLENNYSCDCNRHLEYERGRGATEDEAWAAEIECGDGILYSVLRIETDDGRYADPDTGEWRRT